MDLKYPISKLKLTSKLESWDDLEEALRQELLQSLASRDFQIQALSEHNLFKQLGGNPHSISLLACCRANPLESFSLKEIYQMVVNNRIMNLLANQGDLKTNEISLRISSEAIINLLSEINPDALTFFYFLSMLPIGSLPAHLKQMWGDSHGKCTEILKSFGMLEPSTDRIILTPFMMNYADQTIDRASKELFNKKIAEFYEEMLRNFYNEDVTQRNSITIREELNNNIRLCIIRLLGVQSVSSCPVMPSFKKDK
jgi:hypothetical protein